MIATEPLSPLCDVGERMDANVEYRMLNVDNNLEIHRNFHDERTRTMGIYR